MATAFQSSAFQNNAFQVDPPVPNLRNIIEYIRRYLNDLDGVDSSTHSVSFSVSVRSAAVITYIRRYLNDVDPVVVPANALLAEDGTPILTENGDFILVE